MAGILGEKKIAMVETGKTSVLFLFIFNPQLLTALKLIIIVELELAIYALFEHLHSFSPTRTIAHLNRPFPVRAKLRGMYAWAHRSAGHS